MSSSPYCFTFPICTVNVNFFLIEKIAHISVHRVLLETLEKVFFFIENEFARILRLMPLQTLSKIDLHKILGYLEKCILFFQPGQQMRMPPPPQFGGKPFFRTELSDSCGYKNQILYRY